ncbi:unnamed protein product [Moneuplotes crassus]|uniref:Uncharacterized protein n=1 Tax=Euplotes crassus TaxID=5936 RepID=A0AAD1XVA3_EUPCR|nr:unnamed protein product [Moneuplotes crassus]
MELTKANLEQQVSQEEHQFLQKAHEIAYKCFSKQKRQISTMDKLVVNYALKYESKGLLKTIEHFGAPRLKYVHAIQDSNYGYFRKFIKTSRIKEFLSLNIKLDANKIEKYSYYHRFIIRLLPRVTNSLSLCKCKIAPNQLRKFIQIGRHIKDIQFIQCNIVFGKIQFNNNLHYSIRSIAFNMENCVQELTEENILEGIKCTLTAASLTDLKSSLNSVKISRIKLKASIKEHTRSLGFDKVRVCIDLSHLSEYRLVQ